MTMRRFFSMPICAGLLVAASCTQDQIDTSGPSSSTEFSPVLISRYPDVSNSEVDTALILRWSLVNRGSGDTRAATFYVSYGDTGATELTALTPAGMAADSLRLGGLQFGKTYSWRVCATIEDVDTCTTWRFTVRPQTPSKIGWKIIDKYTSSIADNEITALSCDNSGAMWVGTLSKGAYGIANDAVQTYYANDGSKIPSCAITGIVFDAANNMWVATSSYGLVKIAAAGPTVFQANASSNSLPCNQLLSLSVDSSNTNVIAGGYYNGNRLLTNGQTKWYSSDTSAVCRILPGGVRWSVAWKSTKQLWAGFDTTLMLVNDVVKRKPAKIDTTLHIDTTERTDTTVTPPTTKKFFDTTRTFDTTLYYYYDSTSVSARYGSANQSALKGHVTGIALDTLQRLWIATADSGVVRFAASEWTTYRKGSATGLPSDNTSSIAIDKTNRVWIGTNRGIVVYDNQ